MNRILVILMLILSFGVANAQDSLSTKLYDALFTNDTRMTNQAIEPGCYFVRQDYVLQDSLKNNFGRGGNDYFGKAHGIGVLAGGRLWVESRLLDQWERDSNFAFFRDSLNAGNSDTFIKQVPDDSVSKKAVTIHKHTSPLSYYNLGDSVHGFNIVSEVKSGKLMTFYVDPKSDPENAYLKSQVTEMNVLKWDSTGMAPVNNAPLKKKQIIGGALFKESVELGRIEFRLAALLVYVDRQWHLQKIPEIQTQALTPVPIEPKINDDKNNRKKKKRGKKKKKP
ncbi:MAG: hypothetical protein AAFX87_05855 [Bacteroidota bacterium]